MTATIFTLGTSIMLLLSLLAAALGLLVVEKAFRVSRRWDRADEEERYELEKEFYVAYAVVCADNCVCNIEGQCLLSSQVYRVSLCCCSFS